MNALLKHIGFEILYPRFLEILQGIRITRADGKIAAARFAGIRQAVSR